MSSTVLVDLNRPFTETTQRVIGFLASKTAYVHCQGPASHLEEDT